VEIEYRDKTLACSSCGESFVWSAAEQLFFAGRRLRHEPRRCKACRERRRGRSGPRERRGVELPCAACGRLARLPFRPSQARPVYCPACHEAGKR
jgi:CxxC-x17-CxxC domain-containing protein